ncbi:MAG: hypothetical protein WC444_05570 [Candidatus Paceibacterota bacterium]
MEERTIEENIEKKQYKILLAFPTSKEKDYVLKEFLENLKHLDYPFHIFAVDTTLGDHENKYTNHLRSLGVETVKFEWDPSAVHTTYMLSQARDLIRQKAVDEGYDYLMSVDSDMIIPHNTITDLIRYDKDCIGYPYNIFARKGQRSTPCVTRSGKMYMQDTPQTEGNKYRRGLDLLSWNDIRYIKADIARVYGAGLGCCLIKRKVLENTRFRSHPDICIGEDVWYWNEVNEKGYEMWIVPRKRPIHKMKTWKVKATQPLGGVFINLHKEGDKVVGDATVAKLTKDQLEEVRKQMKENEETWNEA